MPSRQLQQYLQLRADGMPVDVASERSGIGLTEARFYEEDLASGELVLPQPTKEPVMGGLTNEEEERETPQPHVKANVDAIAKLIAKDGRIDKLKEKMDKARGELGTEYQKIENDLHGHRGAVKLIHKLRNGTTDEAYSFMRTFLHLAERFDLLPADDLVDLAQKVDQPKAEEEPGVSAADKAPKSATVHEFPQKESALDRHKKALVGGDKPPAPKGPAGDTDLVEAGEDVAREIEASRERDAKAFEDAEAATSK